MWTPEEIKALRRAYAHRTMFVAGLASPVLEAAFASVPREAFLGPPPWKVFRWAGYADTSDLAIILSDVVVGLIPDQGLNNGQPSAHAMWMSSAEVKPGDHVVHIGAGTGYYTAILAELAGSAGRVTALEFNPGLAVKASAHLAKWTRVNVLAADATQAAFDPADVIYVNAGATHPIDAWLEKLKEGGRLVMALTTDDAFSNAPPRGPVGAVFCFTRRGDRFSARFITGAAYIPGEGMRDPASEKALAAGFAAGRFGEVKMLYRGAAAAALAPDQVWARAPGWALAYR